MDFSGEEGIWYEAGHECQYSGCGQHFRRRQEMEKHMNEWHTGSQRCQIPGCGFTSQRKARLKNHLAIYHGFQTEGKLAQLIIESPY